MDNTGKLRASVSEFAKSLDMPPFIYEINELLDQRAYEQVAIKEKLAMLKIADMWAIVQSVGQTQATYYDHNVGWYECPFCNGGDDRDLPDKVKHEAGCIVTKARKMVAEVEQGA